MTGMANRLLAMANRMTETDCKKIETWREEL